MCIDCCGNCKPAGKPIKYQCDCEEGECATIEFDCEPCSTPYCCGKPMKRVQ